MSLVSFPKADNAAIPTKVDSVCESDYQLTTWLFALQRLYGMEDIQSSAPYTYEAILLQRFMYQETAHTHDLGLTVRQ